MLGIYFKIEDNYNSNIEKTNISNKIHNFLLKSLNAIKLDNKTRFFIVNRKMNIVELRNQLRVISKNKVQFFIFEISSYAGYMDDVF